MVNEDVNGKVLRSGVKVSIVTPQQQRVDMANPEQSTLPLEASPAVTPNLSVAPTIKIVHQDALVKRFCGEDIAYSALAFLSLCKDLMRNGDGCRRFGWRLERVVYVTWSCVCDVAGSLCGD